MNFKKNKKEVQFCVRLEKSILDLIDMTAETNDVTRTQVIRTILSDYYKKEIMKLDEIY